MKKVIVGTVVAVMFSGISHASDRDTLEMLYYALSGDKWDIADGWLSKAPLNNYLQSPILPTTIEELVVVSLLAKNRNS